MAQTMLPNNYSARLDIERMFAAAQNIAADGQNSGKIFFYFFGLRLTIMLLMQFS